MNLPLVRGKKWNYLAMAFAIPALTMLCLMIASGCTPFGNYSMLYSDMWHQYFPFFKAFRLALRNGDSLLYSWNVGMGMDYLGLISYYLASPLNLVSVLLPESWVLPYFALLVPIKLGFAGLFFAIFLKKMFGKDDLSIALFGAFYALCAWALGYQWNIMWLDTFALLPLVALGTISLLRDKKFILYVVSLFLSVVVNYYVGFFTCIFVLLLFICYQISYCKSMKRLALDFVRIGCFTVLAIGMTAVLMLPTLDALGDTYSSINTYPSDFSLNIVEYAKCADAREAWKAYKLAVEAGEPAVMLWLTAVKESFGPILDGMKQVAGNMGGGISPTFKEGLPNVYSGVGTILLAFLFLTAKQIRWRERICALGLLLFFTISFIIRQLDYIWHGFHFTNMIPYRFSFLFSFVMLYMAYRAFALRYEFKPWKVLAAGILSICLLSFSPQIKEIPEATGKLGEMFSLLGQTIGAVFSGNQETLNAVSTSLQQIYKKYGQAYTFLVYNGVFLLLYAVFLLYPCLQKKLRPNPSKNELKEFEEVKINRRRLASTMLALVMALEIAMNIVNFGVNFSYTNITTYPRGTTYTESMIRYMKEREDSLFYRVEATHSQTLNDGALNDYNGISTFTSSANVKVTEFMRVMGYGAKNNYNRYCFEESSPVANLFLNLKYMLEREGKVEENSYFDVVHSYGDVYLLENNAYLPLGFLAESELADLDFFATGRTAFKFQNELFSVATGLPDAVFNTVYSTVKGQNVTINSSSSGGLCSYKAGTGSGKLIYQYNIQTAGFMCLDLTMNARNSFSVYHNGQLLYSESLSLPQTLAVCEVKPGDVVELKATCKSEESNTMTVRAAIVNEEVFRKGYDILAASTLELTKFSTTRVEGNISCNRDGLLYTSIPYNGNWKATVDGKEADIHLVGGAMIALELTKGDHEIVFTYENKSFTIGLLVSIACLLIFLGLAYWQNQQTVHEKVRNIIAKFPRK